MKDFGKNRFAEESRSISFQMLSVKYFHQYYCLIAMAVCITVAIIVGSLLIGNSVRQTLVHRVAERLGNTETVIFSRNSFIADSILLEPLFAGSAHGVLLTNGFVPSGGKLIPVRVWGMENEDMQGKALLNSSLAKELQLSEVEDIVLRLPKGGLVPSGSLFVTDNYTVSLRLEQGGIKNAEEGGNISLKNEQSIPFNIFVCRQELAEVMELGGKINLILSEINIDEDMFADTWNEGYSGIKITPTQTYTELTSDRVFLQKDLVSHVQAQNDSVNPLFSYLANGIRCGEISVPYSFVTALEEFNGYRLQLDELVLSDYTAHRLGAKVGDTISVSFYVSKGLKDLKTDSVVLRIGKIIPLEDMVADGALSAEFPGLSNVERCTDWDSDLPIDMGLITDEDEDYWNKYRSTPKALLPYQTMKESWSNDYGTATALRIYDDVPVLEGMKFSMFDIQVVHPRENGLYAARNGIDFASLFFALGFFIIVSALLLMLSPLGEMYWQRRQEIALLQSVGYGHKRIIVLLWKEAFPVVAVAALIGVGVGVLYTAVIMWLLGNIWQGATQTSGLGVYLDTTSVIGGLIASIVPVLWLLYRSIAKAVKEQQTFILPDKKKILSSRSYHKVQRFLPILLTLLCLGIFVLNIFYVNSIYLFVLLGLLVVWMAGLWGEYIVTKKSRPSDRFTLEQQIYGTLYYERKQLRVSFYALALGVFSVFAVGLNRQQVSDSIQQTEAAGGYSLWVESTVPVYYDLNTAEGRHQLLLDDLPPDAEILQMLKLGADDASCLNLNKVTQPTVLGVDMMSLQNSTFHISQQTEGEGFGAFTRKTGDCYPVLLDEESLMWSLGMSVGDTLYYQRADGETVSMLIAGALSTGIFQGYALMDKQLFRELWPEISGTELMLLKTGQTQEVSQLMSQALNEYGIRVTTVAERLNKFNELVNTYLSIFLSLGGIGILLGLFAFIVVIRKNLLVRKSDVCMYESLGYSRERIRLLLFRENISLPLYAILSGMVAALLSVCNNFGNNNWQTWGQSMIFALLFVGMIWWFVKREVSR